MDTVFLKRRYSEGKDSLVSHDGNLYLVDKLLDISKSKKIELIKISDLIWNIENISVDKDRLNKVKIDHPIIIVKTKKYGLVVLDGNHRLMKAFNTKLVSIECIILSEKEIELALFKNR